MEGTKTCINNTGTNADVYLSIFSLCMALNILVRVIPLHYCTVDSDLVVIVVLYFYVYSLFA